MNALVDIGIDYGQGYYIQRPSELLPTIDKNLINLIIARNIKKRELYISKSTTVFIGDICRKSMTIDSNCSGSVVLEIFSQNPALMGLPVVDNGKISGLIMKDKFFAKLGTQYGYALYTNRLVNILMDNRPLSVDYETTLDIVSKKAVARNEATLTNKCRSFKNIYELSEYSSRIKKRCKEKCCSSFLIE